MQVIVDSFNSRLKDVLIVLVKTIPNTLNRGKQTQTAIQWLSSSIFLAQFKPLTPGTFLRKVLFLDILVIFRLDLGQITFNPVENAFATQQLAFLATSITF